MIEELHKTCPEGKGIVTFCSQVLCLKNNTAEVEKGEKPATKLIKKLEHLCMRNAEVPGTFQLRKIN